MMRSIGVTHVVVNTDALSDEKMARVRVRTELQLLETFGTLALYRLVR